jgi:hypothetical protein
MAHSRKPSRCKDDSPEFLTIRVELVGGIETDRPSRLEGKSGQARAPRDGRFDEGTTYRLLNTCRTIKVTAQSRATIPAIRLCRKENSFIA